MIVCCDKCGWVGNDPNDGRGCPELHEAEGFGYRCFGQLVEIPTIEVKGTPIPIPYFIISFCFRCLKDLAKCNCHPRGED